jgi:hypothetical protein
MNKYSFFLNRVLSIICIICILCTLLSGCYSFTGGTVPEHLKTISIGFASDNSGFGNPRFRDILTQRLVERFRNDNTFVLIDAGGDARLQPVITSIADATVTVSPGEVERERKMTVSIEVEYTDAVKKKTVWKRIFSNFQVYQISQGQQARESAVEAAIGQLCEDILLGVVSGW